MNAITEYPCAPEAERAVLAALMLDPDAAGIVFDTLGHAPEVFHEGAHRTIFQAAVSLHKAGLGIDVPMIVGTLHKSGQLDEAGGGALISDLASEHTTGHFIEQYCAQVLDAATRRALVSRGNSLAIEAARGERDSRELLGDYQRDLEALADRHTTGQNARLVGDDLEALLARFEAMRTSGGVIGTATGYADLDRILGGLAPGSLAILAARPSVGKTALALNVAANVAEAGTPVLFCSLEMTGDELRERLLLSLAGISKHLLSALSFEDMSSKLSGALDRLAKMPLYIDDRPALSTIDLRAAVRAAVRRHGVKMIIVDYLQLIKPESRRQGATRNDEVGELSAACKSAAKEFGLPVLVLSQLSRLGDCDEPKLSHLRDSGAIEQDADVAILLSKKDASGSVVRVNVAKNRNGSTGETMLEFNKSTQTFRPHDAAWAADAAKHGACATPEFNDDDESAW